MFYMLKETEIASFADKNKSYVTRNHIGKVIKWRGFYETVQMVLSKYNEGKYWSMLPFHKVTLLIDSINIENSEKLLEIKLETKLSFNKKRYAL